MKQIIRECGGQVIRECGGPRGPKGATGATGATGPGPTQIGARVYRATDQAIGDAGIGEPISFSDERWNPNGLWAVGDPTKFTIVTPGRYGLAATLRWAANATGRRSALFIINSGTGDVANIAEVSQNAGVSELTQTLSTIYDFIAGDYVELWAFQTSGAPLNVASSEPIPTDFTIELLSVP